MSLKILTHLSNPTFAVALALQYNIMSAATTRLFAVSFCLVVCSVKLQAQFSCGNTAQSKFEDAIQSRASEFVERSDVCVRVYFHVIRRSSGSDGLSPAEVAQAFDILQSDFFSTGISFVWDESIRYIDDDFHFRTASTDIYNVDPHRDGVDVYLASASASGDGGRADGIGEGSAFYVRGSISGTPTASNSVLSHEMGHVLGLYHSFQGTASGSGVTCAELVNGSNSNRCGDLVADTPADPDVWTTDARCRWTGAGTDANGDTYRPNKELFMAYTPPNCMSVFTPGQADRMLATISAVNAIQRTTLDCGWQCGDDVLISNPVSAATYSGSVRTISDFGTITSVSSIRSSLDVDLHYIASSRIRLIPGFRVERNTSGHSFSATIEACNNVQELRTEFIDPYANEDFPLDLVVSPNPASARLEVQTTGLPDAGTISISNSVGTTVLTSSAKSGGSHHFNIEHLPNGMYIVHLRFADDYGIREISKKIIINHL